MHADETQEGIFYQRRDEETGGRGAAVGVLLKQIGKSWVEALNRRLHHHMKGALRLSKHCICIRNAAQTRDWEFTHRFMLVSPLLCKQVLRGQVVISLNLSGPDSTWHHHTSQLPQ